MRIQLLIATAFSVALVAGCEQESSCPDNLSDYVDILNVTGLSGFEAFERLEDGSLTKLSDSMPVAIENLELHVNIEFIDTVPDQQSASWNWIDFFIKPANACSPAPSFIESKIVGMQLISSAALSSDLGPGVSLAGSFFAEEIFNQNIEYGSDDAIDSRILDAYSSEEPAIAGASYILTALPSGIANSPSPQSTELHQFTYSIELDTGELFEVVSDGVLISSLNNQ